MRTRQVSTTQARTRREAGIRAAGTRLALCLATRPRRRERPRWHLNICSIERSAPNLFEVFGPGCVGRLRQEERCRASLVPRISRDVCLHVSAAASCCLALSAVLSAQQPAAAAGTAVTAGRSLPDTRPTSGTEEPASVSEPPQRGDAARGFACVGSFANEPKASSMPASSTAATTSTTCPASASTPRRRARRWLPPSSSRTRASGTRPSARPARPSRHRSTCGRRSWTWTAEGRARPRSAARLGRQEIAFGDQRLVGHANWINSGRTFDAARVTVKSKPAQIDLFAASVVRILDGEFDKSGNGNRFAGAYVSSGRILPQGTAEPYVFWRRDINQRAETGPLDSLQQVTTGARLVGKLPGATRLQRGDGRPARLPRARFGARLGRTLADPRDAEGLQDPARDGRIQLCVGRRRSSRRHSGHVRSALPDRARQVRPGRPGGLAEHPSRPHRVRHHPDQGHADLGELPLGTGSRRNGTRSTRRAAPPWRAFPAAPRAAASGRRSTCRSRVP